jgi:glycosyltransferase involved in cell wall biosynthesis
MGLTYAAVTPARDEAENLPRLAAALLAQTVRPVRWVVVENGSTDGTDELVRALAAEHDWIRLLQTEASAAYDRTSPYMRAWHAGVEALDGVGEVVVKLDADVSFEPNHFERLLAEFERDPALGIAGSTCWEERNGSWQEQRVARSHVRGAVRAYRRECLVGVLPLEERFGWDTIDELKAQLNGWQVRSIADLAFYHHRQTGQRDGARRSWESHGDLAWYLGYRPSYLLLRTAFRACSDPSALATLYGWARAALRREPRYANQEVRWILREQQSMSQLPLRAREVLRSRSSSRDRGRHGASP